MRITLVEVTSLDENPDRIYWINPNCISGVTQEIKNHKLTGNYIVFWDGKETTVTGHDWHKLRGTRCKIGG